MVYVVTWTVNNKSKYKLCKTKKDANNWFKYLKTHGIKMQIDNLKIQKIDKV